MDINKDLIKKIQQKSPDFQTKIEIQRILFDYKIHVSLDDIIISQKSFSCAKLNLYQKIFIKKNKKKIIQAIQEYNPYICDII